MAYCPQLQKFCKDVTVPCAKCKVYLEDLAKSKKQGDDKAEASKMAKLITGKEYLLYGAAFIYDGFTEAYSHWCDRCGKPREYMHWFHIGDIDNPFNVAKYGSECIKHITVELSSSH